MRYGGVFYYVVQEGGADGGGAEPDFFGADAGYGDGVVNVGLPGFATLVAVAVVGQFHGTAHLLPVSIAGGFVQAFEHVFVSILDASLLFNGSFQYFGHLGLFWGGVKLGK